MRAVPLVLLIIFSALQFARPAYSEAVPKFRSFPAQAVTVRRPAKLDLGSSEAKKYRTRLREGLKGGPNFAGHYTLVSWGCGATCVTGAVVNNVTGKTAFIPFTICCWQSTDDRFKPVEARVTSRLVVF